MDGRILDQLYQKILTRSEADPETSWTAKLLQSAPDLPAKKLGEETTEVIIEALKGDRKALTSEVADLLYHLLVLMAASDVSPQEVWHELEKRQSQSGIAEKARRK